MRKRTHVYCQVPESYEIGRCPVSDEHEIAWSEFEERLWCFVCEKDFEPERWGVFDGPIPTALAKEIGMSFDRINIKTGKRVPQPDHGDEKALNRYHRTWNRGRP